MDFSHAMKNISPWNWFRNEAPQAGGSIPVQRGSQARSAPISRLHDDIDRLFDDFFGGFGLPQAVVPGLHGMGGVLRPQLDIREGKDAYTITVEIPGVDRDDVDITVQDRTLTIRGEKRQESSDDSDGVHRVERSYGRFQRLLSLPQDADENRIDAKFKNGVLSLTIGRNKELSDSAKRIAIKS